MVSSSLSRRITELSEQSQKAGQCITENHALTMSLAIVYSVINVRDFSVRVQTREVVIPPTIRTSRIMTATWSGLAQSVYKIYWLYPLLRLYHLRAGVPRHALGAE